MGIPIPYQKACKKELAREFDKLLDDNIYNKPLLIVCIGTDKATGDAFGPLVGTFLKKKRKIRAIIKGTIEEPVHAKNLHLVNTDNYYTIAIDACLCASENHLKHYCFDYGSIRPGKGVNKNLPPIGDCSITFNVNVSCPLMNYLVLQNTRLNDVYPPAELLANVIYKKLIEKKIV